MVAFEVNDMTCGACASRIARALKEADPHANVAVDIPARLVWVDANASARELADAIRDAGYTPVDR